MTCPHCGAETPEETRFCVVCGLLLPTRGVEEEPGAPPPSPWFPPPPSRSPGEAARQAAPVTPAAWSSTPPTARPSAAWLTAGWTTALIQGLLAFVVMAALGQAASFAVYAVEGSGGLPISTFVRIGWFYFGAFHHVALSVGIPNLGLGGLGGVLSDPNLPANASVDYQLGFALLLVTALAVWLLYRAGREVADRAGGGPVARAIHGLKVAPVYALPAFLFSLLVSIKVSIPLEPLMSGELHLKLSAAQSFVLPFTIAAVAGVAGGLRSVRKSADGAPLGRLSGVLSGGVWMLLLGMALSYLGLFLAGAVQPDDPIAAATPSTAKYYRAVFREPDVGAVLLAHHLAVAPNEAMWVLVPAMGSCDGVYGATSFAFLCYDKYPLSVSLSSTNALGGLGATAQTQPPKASFGTIPVAYFLFLLAPALAALFGGRRAATRGGARTRSEAAALGGAAGVVFALLVVGVGYLSTITAGVAASSMGIGAGGSIRLGPDLVSGGLVALAWGVVGGILGGLLHGRSLASPSAATVPAGAGFETTPETAPASESPPEPPA